MPWVLFLTKFFPKLLLLGFFLVFKGKGNRDLISSPIYEWECTNYDTSHDHILKKKLYLFPFVKVTYFINHFVGKIDMKEIWSNFSECLLKIHGFCFEHSTFICIVQVWIEKCLLVRVLSQLILISFCLSLNSVCHHPPYNPQPPSKQLIVDWPIWLKLWGYDAGLIRNKLEWQLTPLEKSQLIN